MTTFFRVKLDKFDACSLCVNSGLESFRDKMRSFGELPHCVPNGTKTGVWHNVSHPYGMSKKYKVMFV